MDHKREHRTPPLARAMGVGRQQQEITELKTELKKEQESKWSRKQCDYWWKMGHLRKDCYALKKKESARSLLERKLTPVMSGIAQNDTTGASLTGPSYDVCVMGRWCKRKYAETPDRW